MQSESQAASGLFVGDATLTRSTVYKNCNCSRGGLGVFAELQWREQLSFGLR